jgi:thiamine pyrophosphokinase
MQRIIIFANGELPDLEQARAILRDDDYILCADGGARHALALDLIPNLVIGDMDSIDSAEWKRLEVKNIPIEFFPRDKNETDLELAINKAIEICEASPLGEHPNEIIIVAALGGRMDHTLVQEAETSSHSSPGREKSQASSPKTCAGIFITKRSTPIKRAASATK